MLYYFHMRWFVYFEYMETQMGWCLESEWKRIDVPVSLPYWGMCSAGRFANTHVTLNQS